MKSKIIAFVLLLVVIAFVVGCTKQQAQPSGEETTGLEDDLSNLNETDTTDELNGLDMELSEVDDLDI